MAIVVETRVLQASKADADRFDDSMRAAMMQLGGPPAGLMVHITRPSGEGFLLCNVWRAETEMRPFYEDVIRPKLVDAGLCAEEPQIWPVWALARP
jgi:hypothetical protein